MLEESLKENSDFKDLIVGYDNLVLELKSKLSSVPYYFVHFSRHDQSHSEKIVQYIEMLLGEKNIRKLSSSDKIMILLSCYSHDIGMALEYRQIKELFSSSDFEEILRKSVDLSYPDLCEIVKKIIYEPETYVHCGSSGLLQLYSDVEIIIENNFRKNHASRSSDYINNSENIKKLLGLRCTRFLSKICSLHDQDIKNILDLPYKENGLFNDYFHPRFVAALLCLCDLLDMDTDRFDPILLKSSSDMPLLSDLHKRKHESLNHFLVENSKIEISANCSSIDVYRIMQQWVDWIKNASTFMILNWDEITPDSTIDPPKVKKCEILLNGNSKWVNFLNSRLVIDANKSINLLEGSNIYQSKFSFVKELIQNAVDSTLIQFYLDCKRISGKDSIQIADLNDLLKKNIIHINDYDITGRFYLENGNVKVEVIDRGVGISTSELPTIARLKGKSKALKQLIESMPESIRPTGAFGIGLLSVFLVANKIEFYTKTENEPLKKITIEDPSKTALIYVEDSDNKDVIIRGTKVVVTIDNNKITQSDLMVVDYIFNVYPKEELILNQLFQRYNNVNEVDSPYLNRQKQLYDYFNVNVIEQRDDKEIEVIKRTSIFPLSGFIDSTGKDDFYEYSQKDGERLIIYGNSNIRYKRIDIEKNCIFEAVIGLYPKVKEDKSLFLFGDIDYTNVKSYGDSVWYRNTLVDNELIGDRLKKIHRVYDLIELKINLLSDKTDSVLTLDHTRIRDNYIDKLDKILSYQVEVMAKDIINDFLTSFSQKKKLTAPLEKNEQKMNGYCDITILSFLIYYLSIYLNYKVEDVMTLQNDCLSKIQINNFWSLEGEEKFISLNQLNKEDFFFCKELGPLYDGISRNMWMILSNSINNNENVFIYSIKNYHKHIFQFKLLEAFFFRD